MKGVIEKASIGVVLASSIAGILVIIFAHDGRHSFWLIPLGCCSMTAIFADGAYGNRQPFLPRYTLRALFWLSLLLVAIETLFAVFGGT
jgi:uncharacterized membrane protein YfcA